MKKMVLVPYDQYIRYRSQSNFNTEAFSNPNPNPIPHISVNRGADPNGIGSIPLPSVATEHSAPTENLQSTRANDICNTVIKTTTQEENKDTPTRRLGKDYILEPFGKSQRRAAESVLLYADKCLDWNELGEIKVQGEIIPNSHITDLIKDCISRYKRKTKPVGCAVFYGYLKGIPISLVNNTERIPLIGKGRKKVHSRSISSSGFHDSIPPPGVPVTNEYIDLNGDDEYSWISGWQRR